MITLQFIAKFNDSKEDVQAIDSIIEWLKQDIHALVKQGYDSAHRGEKDCWEYNINRNSDK